MPRVTEGKKIAAASTKKGRGAGRAAVAAAAAAAAPAARRRPAKLRVVTKANRRPTRAEWPPDPARVRSILAGLEELYPDVDCELDRDSPFQLLCATILSAQCTDERVNMVTPALFRRFPDAPAMADAPLTELEELIRSTGFYRQKAKSLRATAAALVRDHAGEVPRTLGALVKLTGVARKTASVVLGTAYGLAEGIVVDTHVQRLAMRLGLTRSNDVKQIEQDLMKAIPHDGWIRFSHQVIWHGRRVCFARKPGCADCSLSSLCPSAFREG